MVEPVVPGRRPDLLLVGLGNPGPRYAATRHNLGFKVLDLLARRWQADPWAAGGRNLIAAARVADLWVLLVKPQTFMNRSGEGVAPLLAHSGVEIGQVVVVHDDLDLPYGRLRIRVRGGHGGHNGVRSLIDCLGAGEFVRVKLGIGRPEPGGDVVDHVLSPFSPEEQSALPEFLERTADAVQTLVVEGPTRAMNLFPS